MACRQSVGGSRSGRWCPAHHVVVAGIPSQKRKNCWKNWTRGRDCLLRRSLNWAAPQIWLSGPTNRHSFNGGNGGYGETTAVKEARAQSAAFRRYMPLNPLFPPNLLNGLLNFPRDRIRGPGSFCPRWVGGRNGMLRKGGGKTSWRWWLGSIQKVKTE